MESWSQKTRTINIFIHFPSQRSHTSSGFLPQSPSEATAHIALRIHVRLDLEEPLDHGIVALRALPNAAVCSLGSRGPGAKPQAEPNETKGRNLKLCLDPLHFRNIVVLRCLRPSNWLKKAISARSAVNMIWINLKTYKNRDTGTLAKFENNPESLWLVSLLLVFHVTGRTWPN